jgi:ubiquinone/menaquinone biosynthesis C-methylase UbiE
MEMIRIIFWLVGFGVLFFLGNLIWRLFSQSQSLPCPAWLGWMVEMENPFTKVSSSHFIVDHLDLAPGMQVLDAGCGPGRVTLPLAEAVGPGGGVIALDIQSDMLDRVRSKAHDQGLENIRFQQVELGRGDFRASGFDRAVMVSVLGEIPEPQAALQEIYAALKPGGILSVTEVIFDPHFQSRAKIQTWAETVGFKQKIFLGKSLAYTVLFEKPGAGKN